MRRVVLHAPAQFDTVNLRVAQDLSRIFHADEVEQQIRRQIAAPGNHSVRKAGDPGRPSNGVIKFRRRIPIGSHVKNRAVSCAEKTISHV